MIDPKKNGNRTLRVRYDSGAVFVGPAIITDEGGYARPAGRSLIPARPTRGRKPAIARGCGGNAAGG